MEITENVFVDILIIDILIHMRIWKLVAVNIVAVQNLWKILQKLKTKIFRIIVNYVGLILKKIILVYATSVRLNIRYKSQEI